MIEIRDNIIYNVVKLLLLLLTEQNELHLCAHKRDIFVKFTIINGRLEK